MTENINIKDRRDLCREVNISVLSANEPAAFDPSMQGFCSKYNRVCQSLLSRHAESWGLSP